MQKILASSASAEPRARQAEPRDAGAKKSRSKSWYERTPEGHQSAKALAARRANIAKARAVARDVVYRSTDARRAASLANLAKAHAWRRSEAGNAVARANALRHGLAVKRLPEQRLAEESGGVNTHGQKNP